MRNLLNLAVFAVAILQATALLPPLPDKLGDVLDKCNGVTPEQARQNAILLDITKNGLKSKVGNKPVHVIIVGAGIAGLTAGYTLKKAGYNITILEASNRAGGRIQTHYADTWYAELGPMRIPEKHHFTNAWVKKFGLQYRSFIEENPNTWYYVNGQKVQKWDGDENPQKLMYPTTEFEKGKNAVQLYNEVLNKLDINPEECTEKIDCLRKYDRWSLKAFLIEKGKLSDGAIAMVGVILDEDNLMYTSLSETIVLQHQLNLNQSFHEIVGGQESLPKAISPYLERDIIYNARVTKVSQDKESVNVTYNQGTVSGTHVIMTTSMPSASFITFEPQLTFQKREAIENIHYITLLRIIMAFKEPFWKVDNITGGRTVTDLPIRFTYYPTHLPANAPYPLIVSYANSDDGDKFDGLSDDFILLMALDNLATIHGPRIHDLYVNGSGRVKKWRNDPYSLGGVAIVTPYQIREYYNAFDKPDGRIYFCGETDLPHGWMDTSIKTAMRTVCQITAQNKLCN